MATANLKILEESSCTLNQTTVIVLGWRHRKHKTKHTEGGKKRHRQTSHTYKTENVVHVRILVSVLSHLNWIACI